jgi:hypothetical protein
MSGQGKQMPGMAARDSVTGSGLTDSRPGSGPSAGSVTPQPTAVPGTHPTGGQRDDAAIQALPAGTEPPSGVSQASLPPSPASRPSGRDGDPFDRWLSEELSRIYDPALNEPVPDDMLRLLQEAARRR